jgi:hypothetical protein
MEAASRKPAKNKLCPCQSGRKYKNCCQASDTRRLHACGQQRDKDGPTGDQHAGMGQVSAVAVQVAALHLQTLDI